MTTFAHHFDVKGIFLEGLINKFHAFDPDSECSSRANLFLPKLGKKRFCYSEQINRGLFASDILKWLPSVFSDAGTTFPNIH